MGNKNLILIIVLLLALFPFQIKKSLNANAQKIENIMIQTINGEISIAEAHVDSIEEAIYIKHAATFLKNTDVIGVASVNDLAKIPQDTNMNIIEAMIIVLQQCAELDGEKNPIKYFFLT